LAPALLLFPAATDALAAPKEPELELPGLLLLPDGLTRPAAAAVLSLGLSTPAAAVLSLALVLGVLEPDSAWGLEAVLRPLLLFGAWLLVTPPNTTLGCLLALLLCGEPDTAPLLRDPG
jgi:hypothetical protein